MKKPEKNASPQVLPYRAEAMLVFGEGEGIAASLRFGLDFAEPDGRFTATFEYRSPDNLSESNSALLTALSAALADAAARAKRIREEGV